MIVIYDSRVVLTRNQHLVDCRVGIYCRSVFVYLILKVYLQHTSLLVGASGFNPRILTRTFVKRGHSKNQYLIVNNNSQGQLRKKLILNKPVNGIGTLNIFLYRICFLSKIRVCLLQYNSRIVIYNHRLSKKLATASNPR